MNQREQGRMLGFLAITFCFGGLLAIIGTRIARPQINAASNKFLAEMLAGLALPLALVLLWIIFLYVFIPILARCLCYSKDKKGGKYGQTIRKI